ncbi:DHA2 family efflux MFS transporter permease subunit [bacterium]|nr:MAG: DHA2 family efflux MFS transporter permease subunit [bacterium]
MTATTTSSREQQNPQLVLANVCVGLFMAALNQRALLVSLPTLTRLFQTNLTTIQWTLLAYDLTLIGLVLTLGRLGDLFGRKRIYASGYLLFVCGSALCGVSQSPSQLIAFRIFQGIGGSMLVANGRALLMEVFPPDQRGKALGFASMAFHVGFLMGPTLGGFLIDTVGWRWNFFINIPFGLLGAYLAWRILTEAERKSETVRIDIQGAFLLLVTNASFLYAMNQLPHLGPHHPRVFSLILLSAITLLLFIWTELRVETPILSLSLFRSRLFSAANLSLFFITSTQSAISFLMPFYLQTIMGFTPTQMGWIIIANSVVIVMVAPLAGQLSDRLGSRLLCTIGAGFMVTGQYFIASLTLDSTVVRIILPLALSGLGWAAFNSPNQSAMLGSVSRDKVGAASGMSVTTARIGGATGTALSATLFTHGLASAGLTQMQIESPQSWGAFPEIFSQTFSHTVHIINFFTLLSVFFSAVRGGKESLSQRSR